MLVLTLTAMQSCYSSQGYVIIAKTAINVKTFRHTGIGQAVNSYKEGLPEEVLKYVGGGRIEYGGKAAGDAQA